MEPTSLHPPAIALRGTAALMRWSGRAAQLAGRGGSVIPGHVGLRLDPHLLPKLAQHRKIVAVSATNGKTTTTNLLAAALRCQGSVVANTQGSNLKSGIVAALAQDLTSLTAALEVDEATLAVVADELRPVVVVLGNLSRDQLDRYGEVRILAKRWHDTFERLCCQGVATQVIANADDPLVVWSARSVPHLTWVAAGSPWSDDAQVCPDCTAPIVHADRDWHCTGCDLARPVPQVTFSDDAVSFHDTENELLVPLELSLPGTFNRANAALALTAARAMGVDVHAAARAMGSATEVAGRYRTVTIRGRTVRMLMAKNPAGWQAALSILRPAPTPIILSINAQVADGHDPSWLYDVPFEALAHRTVVVTGERAYDLSVRLHYGGIDHVVEEGPAQAVIATVPVGDVDFVANYTAFNTALSELK